MPSLSGPEYGAPPMKLAATASSGLPVSYTVTGPAKLSGSTSIVTVAGYVTMTATQSGNATFAPAAPVEMIVNVVKASLTVTANNLVRNYGAVNPALTYAITGFVDGDTASVVSGTANLSTTAIAASPAGTYPITGSSSEYFGFPGATGEQTAIQEILAWTYSGGSGCPVNP